MSIKKGFDKVRIKKGFDKVRNKKGFDKVRIKKAFDEVRIKKGFDKVTVKSLFFSLDTFFPMFQFTQTAHRVHSFSDLEMLTVTII